MAHKYISSEQQKTPNRHPSNRKGVSRAAGAMSVVATLSLAVSACNAKSNGDTPSYPTGGNTITIPNFPAEPSVERGGTLDFKNVHIPSTLPRSVASQEKNVVSVVAANCLTLTARGCSQIDTKHGASFTGVDIGGGTILGPGHLQENQHTNNCGNLYFVKTGERGTLPLYGGKEDAAYNDPNIMILPNEAASRDLAVFQLSQYVLSQMATKSTVSFATAPPKVGEVDYLIDWQSIPGDPNPAPGPGNKIGPKYDTPTVIAEVLVGQNAGGELIYADNLKGYGANHMAKAETSASGGGYFNAAGQLVAIHSGYLSGVDYKKVTDTTVLHAPADLIPELATPVTNTIVEAMKANMPNEPACYPTSQ